MQTPGLSQRLRALFALRPESGALEPGAKQLLELHFNASGTLQSAMALAACADLTIPIREPLTGRTEVVLPLRVSLRSAFSRWAPACLAGALLWTLPQSLRTTCLLLTVHYKIARAGAARLVLQMVDATPQYYARRWMLTPASGLDFGAITAGGGGVTQSVEVANTGEFALTIRAGDGCPTTTVRSPGHHRQHACLANGALCMFNFL